MKLLLYSVAALTGGFIAGMVMTWIVKNTGSIPAALLMFSLPFLLVLALTPKWQGNQDD